MRRGGYRSEFGRKVLDLGRVRTAELLKKEVPLSTVRDDPVMASQGSCVQGSAGRCWRTRSGYCAWHNRPLSLRRSAQAWRTDVIRQAHAAPAELRQCRGHAELTLGRGITVGFDAVESLMRRAGLHGVTGRRNSGTGSGRRRPPATWSTASSAAPGRTSCG
jgi:hypothetical protein